MPEHADVARPEWALEVMDMKDGQQYICLDISTAATQYKVVLADKSNYKQVANKLAESIRRLGAEIYGPGAGLLKVRNLPDGLRKPPQGR